MRPHAHKRQAGCQSTHKHTHNGLSRPQRPLCCPLLPWPHSVCLHAHTCMITFAPSAAATNSSLSNALPLWSFATVMLAKVQEQRPHSCRRARRNCWSQTVCVPRAPVTVMFLCVCGTGAEQGTSQQVDSKRLFTLRCEAPQPALAPLHEDGREGTAGRGGGSGCSGWVCPAA